MNDCRSFFESLHQPYYIYAGDYRQSSAGIRALHYLCHFLNESGYEAYVVANTTRSGLRTPALNGRVLRQHFLSGKTPIVVYPEVASGNPLGGSTLVRWLLNKPGHLGGDTHYATSDLIFYFDAWALPAGITGEHLRIPTLDWSIFNNRDNEADDRRQGFCYYAHKFLAFGGTIPDEIRRHGISLGQENTLTHEEIAAHLRRAEVLFCFEQSAIIAEARACGCPVLIVPSDYWQKTRWEVFPVGTALSTEFESLARLKQELADTERERQEEFDFCKLLVENFIARTQAYSFTSRTTSQIETSPNGGSIWRLAPAARHENLPEFERNYRHLFADLETTQADLEPVYQPAKSLPGALGEKSTPSAGRASLLVVVVQERESDSALKATLDSLQNDINPPAITIVSDSPSPTEAPPANGVWIEGEGDIGKTINRILESSPNDWVGVIRAGDCFAKDAAALIREFLRSTPQCKALISDVGTVTPHGEFLPPKLFGSLDIELLRTGEYIGALLLATGSTWLKAGGWRKLPRGLDEHDASLRIFETCRQQEFIHCPGILLHRSPGTFPAAFFQQEQVVLLDRQVIQEHLRRSAYPATVVSGRLPHLHMVLPNLTGSPKISAIVLTKDNREGLQTCLRSLLEKTDYPNLEILIVDNGTTEPSARALLDNLAVAAKDFIRIVSYEKPFNPGEMCNTAASIVTGDLLLFLHDDIEAIHDDWLAMLAAHCCRPGIAMAGARLVSRDAKIKEAGIVPMMIGISGNAFHGTVLDDADAHDQLRVSREVSAISAACMLVRRDVFLQLEGMDATHFPSRVADIDFCLKLRAAGHKIIWTPHATLLHDSDGTTAGNLHDNNALLAKWGSFLVNDPYVNPYIALDSTTYQPEHDPTFLPDPIPWHPLPNIYAAMLGDTAVNEYRIGNVIRAATALHRARGRVGTFLPIPVQLKRLSIDVVQLAAPITDHQIKELATYRQLLGCQVVMDLDPLFDESAEHLRLEVQRHDRVVDVFTTSSPMLADMFDDMAGRIVVIPDALDDTLWNGLTTRCQTGEKLRIGWHGSTSDLEAIAPVVMSLADEVDWIFIGEFPEVLEACTRERHRDVASSDYPAKLASLNLDLAVCPLAMTPNNRWRSDLPILQYGALGIPVVATDIDAYRTGLPITLTGNTIRGWTESIRAYAGDRAACRQKGEALREHVLAHRTLAGTMAQWQQAWQPAGCEASTSRTSPMPAEISPPRAIPTATAGRQPGSPREEATAFESAYQQWLSARHDNTTDAGSILEAGATPVAGRFHVILRHSGEDTAPLAETLDGLGRQHYRRWHLDIVTPLAAPPGIEEVETIGWHCLNDGNEKRLIDALVEERACDWVVEIPGGAVLDPLCLWRLAREAALQPEISAFFVDDDVHDGSGARQHPRFKPGVNREWLQRTDLAGPLFVRHEAWIGCGGAAMCSGSPWFDQLVRLADGLGWKSLAHVPDVLISYPETFPTDIKSCLLSLVENLQTRGIGGEIVPATGRTWNIRYPLPAAPKVTVAILSQGQVDLLARCLECVVERTRYPDYEIVISVTDRGLDPEIEDWLVCARQRNDIRIRTVGTVPSGTHAARSNAAVEAANGEFVLLLREEAVVIQANWLDELVRTCFQPDVAAAGPRLMTPNDKRIHDAGQVLGLNGLIDAPYRSVADFEEDGYLDCLKVGRDVTALPAACLLVRKTAYLAAGGMDETNLDDDRLATADLCQKLLRTDERLVYQPLATLLYRGSSELDVGEDDERRAARRQAEHTFAARWLKRGTRDPYWNANLSLIGVTPTPETDYQAQWQFLPTEAPRLLARTLPNAQGTYRVTAPLRALHRAGLASGCIWEQGTTREPGVAELCRLAPDAVIVQHYLMDQYLEALQRWRSSAARPFVVYSLDDLITGLDENNPARRNIPANSRSRFRYALERCDRLVVSTEYLADTYRRFCPDVRIVPNRLEQETWLPLRSRKRTTPKPRIGWAGGDTHQADLLLLQEVIKQTRGEADWIFFGMCPEPLRPLLAEYHELRPLAEYPAHLASLNLDLAVAPLTDTPFNRGKSNLRLLEYGALGIPVVCSDIAPYQGSPACRVGNEAAPWIEAIRSRLHDAEAMEQEGRALKEWVYRGYLLENHLEEWLTAHLPDSDA